MSLIVSPVFSLTDSPFRRKLESAIQSSLVDTNSSQNSSGEHWVTYFMWMCVYLCGNVSFMLKRWEVFSVARAENWDGGGVGDVKRFVWPTLHQLLLYKTQVQELYYLYYYYSTLHSPWKWRPCRIPCWITFGSYNSCHTSWQWLKNRLVIKGPENIFS